jgi:tRNA threonylcarbamoyladenosine biosynthesis protein TsaB
MKLIAIDSSSEACSVAILQGSEIIESWQLAPRQHTQKLLPMLDQLLAQASLSVGQCDAIAFARGPGSFTGLRVCISLVQGLAFGADIPVVPVSSLAALAQSAVDQQLGSPQSSVLAALDARMDQVYWAAYEQADGLVQALTEEKLSAPELVSVDEWGSEKSVIGVGPGFNYGQRLPCAQQCELIEQDLLPRASAVAKLGSAAFAAGLFCRADQATPIYLRDEIAWKKTAEQ